ncbi:PIR protein [Hepatocystis sp. ex Piliocolobus tephrosceles]|nr:PIR protein [Hepatocystis sp. ex Piliocolobus tephrosceles]
MTEVINKLPSRVFYGKLLDKSDLSYYAESPHVHNIEKSIQNFGRAKEIMMMLEKNLDMFYHNEDTPFNKKHCFDVNFWLYNTINENLTKPKSNKKLFKVLDKYHKEWDVINQSKEIDKEIICEPNRTLIDIKYLREVKHLFDYFENFDYVKDEAKKNPDDACKIFYKPLKKLIPIFFRWTDICQLEEPNICNTHISNPGNYTPRAMLKHVNLISLTFSALVNSCFKQVIDLVKQSEQLKHKTYVIVRYKNEAKMLKLIKKKSRSLAETDDMLGILHGDDNSCGLLSYIVWFFYQTYLYINENIILVSAFMLGMLFVFGIFYQVNNISKKKKKN